ncbi:uncharacterized protein BDR25DRAFT_355444 [Lindgomyces ingoldianus]|uniref:Uncharacterized protein n=1 Tax=Lindgomyces ingoldianus TaxID=673940 RepID=A0ACB6QW76_9PLEO|nr:uncharacterized protein BDR25DRAFT_355444 [Lindgomyces ingoldianus]KAF2470330.1 hypothetical protein BDR25DRAFT_355444 [Lindgomyces ingoldianus]
MAPNAVGSYDYLSPGLWVRKWADLGEYENHGQPKRCWLLSTNIKVNRGVLPPKILVKLLETSNPFQFLFARNSRNAKSRKPSQSHITHALPVCRFGQSAITLLPTSTRVHKARPVVPSHHLRAPKPPTIDENPRHRPHDRRKDQSSIRNPCTLKVDMKRKRKNEKSKNGHADLQDEGHTKIHDHRPLQRNSLPVLPNLLCPETVPFALKLGSPRLTLIGRKDKKRRLSPHVTMPAADYQMEYHLAI